MMQVILQCAGTNATRAFDEVHAPGILEENLPQERFKGFLEEPSSDVPPDVVVREDPKARAGASTASADSITGPPALHTLISAADFEKVAGQELSPKTWAFYSSAATDLITHHQNKTLLRRIMLQPRVLRDVRDVDTKRSILGFDSAAPFFISPAAMAKLAHPDGELALARAAGTEGIIQCVGTVQPESYTGSANKKLAGLEQCVLSLRKHYKGWQTRSALLSPALCQLRKAQDRRSTAQGT